MKKYVYLILCFWFILILGFIAKQEFTIQTGREVLLETIPVDPRDLLRGDYVILNYKIAQIPLNYSDFAENETVYVALNPDKKNIAHISDITKEKPCGLYLKGKTCKCQTSIPFYRSGRCISYGIESYFVKEGHGRKLERDLRDGVLVKVVIDKYGQAKVAGFVDVNKATP